MTTTDVTAGTAGAVPTSKLFVRNATGLVRSWATFDGFLYSFFSINIVALGFSFGFYPAFNFVGGNLITAIIVSGALVLFEVIVYASLISVIPRAGGDYVWQTRILGGPVGFVLAATGWIFILWLWVPIYGNILIWEVISPLCAVLGDWTGNSTLLQWSVTSTTHPGFMLASGIVAIFAAVVVALGMKFYARVQKACFYVGGLGLLTMFLMLLFGGHGAFVNGFNHYSAVLGGTSYAKTLAAAQTAGVGSTFSKVAFVGSFALIPFVLFYNLYPNWGASLYGEIRGASDFQRNIRAMGYSVIVNTVLAVLALVLLAKVMTDTFYTGANAAYGGATATAVGLPIWPYPGLLAGFVTTNHLLQLWLIVSLSAFFWGWCGTVFLSSTRVVFAAAFDRVFPDWFARVAKNGAPVNALIAMLVPGLVLSVLYSYQIGHFDTITFDAVLVIAVTFLGSTVAATVMPWRQKNLYNGSPVARYKIAGLPLVSVAGVIFGAFLVWTIYEWMQYGVYGTSSHTSLIFLGILYAGSIVLYAISRFVRQRQGVNLDAVHQEIPVE
jgi:APA family basic amino acid/polyamine antiporter